MKEARKQDEKQRNENKGEAFLAYRLKECQNSLFEIRDFQL